MRSILIRLRITTHGKGTKNLPVDDCVLLCVEVSLYSSPPPLSGFAAAVLSTSTIERCKIDDLRQRANILLCLSIFLPRQSFRCIRNEKEI
jgi:hypothetical protein